jgi:predicted nucleotidyltransferase
VQPYARIEAYFGLLEDLRCLLSCEIDLVMTGGAKSRYIAQHIERTKQILYSA